MAPRSSITIMASTAASRRACSSLIAIAIDARQGHRGHTYLPRRHYGLERMLPCGRGEYKAFNATTRTRAMTAVHKILVVIDPTAETQPALERIAHLPRPLTAQIMLLICDSSPN